MITLIYASLLGLLQVTLAYKAGSSRLKTNTLLGDGNQSEVLQKIRAHGNLIEYAPIFLILLALIEMQGVALWKIHALGSLFFLARIAHSYGMYISTESTPPRLIGILVTWFLIAGMSVYGLVNYILNSMM
jgi:uncharacterized membrane protein YecN with MAPEG domain